MAVVQEAELDSGGNELGVLFLQNIKFLHGPSEEALLRECFGAPNSNVQRCGIEGGCFSILLNGLIIPAVSEIKVGQF